MEMIVVIVYKLPGFKIKAYYIYMYERLISITKLPAYI